MGYDYSYEDDEEEENSGLELSAPEINLPGLNLSSFSWIVIAILLLPFVLYSVPQLVGAKEAYVVESGSMEPAIETGAVVFVYGVKPENIRENDVITFQSDEDEVTTHRVIGVEGSGENLRFETKGDNNEDPDPGFVEADELVGEVMFSVPYLGYVIVWAGGLNAFLLLVLIPAALIILDEIWKIGQEMKGMKEEGDEQEAFTTFMIIISLTILFVSAAMLAGIVPGLSDIASFLDIGPGTFGAIVMAAILIAIVLLRFL